MILRLLYSVGWVKLYKIALNINKCYSYDWNLNKKNSNKVQILYLMNSLGRFWYHQNDMKLVWRWVFSIISHQREKRYISSMLKEKKCQKVTNHCVVIEMWWWKVENFDSSPQQFSSRSSVYIWRRRSLLLKSTWRIKFMMCFNAPRLLS